MGWQFWRCLASDFVRDRVDILNDLVRTLEECHITPTTKGVPVRSNYTYFLRVTIPTTLVDDINFFENEEEFSDQNPDLFDD